MVPVFDIEVMNWTDPVAVGFYDGVNYFEFLRLSEDHDVIWSFLDFIGKNYPGIRLFAHNAAHFDNRFILDCLHRNGQRLEFAGGLAKLVWSGKKITFEDSYILLGRNLRSVCEAFGVERKLEWDHSETTNIWELGSKLDAFRAYLKRDCISLSNVLDEYCKLLLDHFGVTPSSTMSLTAVKAFDKSFYPVKDIDSNETFERFIRRATYGGRNEVYRTYGKNIIIYDIRSMYTSCYDVPVPVSRMVWSCPDIDKGTLAEAKVKVPDMPMGPLPFRLRGRLIFPVGEFQGWWDTRELKYATELGCDVTIIRQLTCDERPVLLDFGKVVSDLRKSSNSELSKIWKLLGLRLSGKFGQHRISTIVKHIEDIEDQTGYYPIDTSETYHEAVVAQRGRRSPYVKPGINMRIRSEARIRHLKWMLKALETGQVYYCDTDSIFTNTVLQTGKEAGDLQYVNAALRGYFIRPKFYGFVTLAGILHQRTSGFHDFSLSEYDFQRLLEGKPTMNEFQSLNNWREILKSKGVRLVPRNRTIEGTKFENRIMGQAETYPIKLG